MNTRDKNYSRDGQNTGFYQQIQNMNQNQIYSSQPPQQANFFYERPRDTKYEFMENGASNHYSPMSSGGNQPVYKPYPLEKTMNYNQNNQVMQNFPNANMNAVMTPQNLSQLNQNTDNRGMDYNGNMFKKQLHSAPARSFDQTFDRPMNTRFTEQQTYDERPQNSRFNGKQVNVDATNRIIEQSALLRGELQQPKNHFLDFMPTTTRSFRADEQRQEHYR